MKERIVIKKAKKEFVEDLGREVTVSKFQKIFVSAPEKDLHTTYGILSKEDLAKPDGSKILTDRKKDYTIFSPDFIDYYKRMERLPQIIPLKDIGFIIAECGLGRNSVVIDTGTGSGAVACFLGNFVKEVHSYEIKQEHFDVAQKNVKSLGLDNVHVTLADGTKGFKEKDVDTVILDLPAPWEAIEASEKALKVGGFCVSYSPTIPQVMDFVQAIEKKDTFLIEKIVELNERQWQVEDRTVRPKSKSIIHSGFLVIVRKIGA